MGYCNHWKMAITSMFQDDSLHQLPSTYHTYTPLKKDYYTNGSDISN